MSERGKSSSEHSLGGVWGSRLMEYMRSSENFGPVVLAMTVGLLGGVGALVLKFLIEHAELLFFVKSKELFESVSWLSFVGDYYLIAIPAVGMLIVGLMVRNWAIEAQGHGVPEVQYAVRKRDGKIRPRVAFVKAIASAICIGSGGSVGREGPIVQIGCSLGSSIGQLFGLRVEMVKVMVACGAAAAIGGIFNAPIAGVMFAMEVVLGNFAARHFGLVVISAVTSTAFCRAWMGSAPTYALEEIFNLNSNFELPLYLIMGALMGVLALVYTKVIYFFEEFFENWKINPNFKTLLGGLLLGLTAYYGSNLVLGTGHEGIMMALENKLAFQTLLLLAVLKLFATSVTLGAGGSGGVFAPALFIGAVAGGAYGVLVGELFPGITAPPGAYALVGMGALFSGAAHAPITSILILFEMTNDYRIILPLMLAVVVSHLIASSLLHDSIYTIKLRRLGGLAPKKSEVSVLDMVLVADAMSGFRKTVRPNMPLSELVSEFHSGHARSFMVLNRNGHLAGIVTEYDVETALMSGEVNDKTVDDIMTRNVITCMPHQSLRDVLQEFTTEDVGSIPVVDRKNPKKVIGVLRRKEILWAYGMMAGEHQRLLDRTGVRLPAHQEDSVQIEIEVKPDQPGLCFRMVRDVKMPEQCLIVVLRRADRAIVPRGNTIIEPGDVLVGLTTKANEKRLRNWVAKISAR